MRILAINSGSSSIKCALIDTADDARLLDIRIEGIGGATQLVTNQMRRQLTTLSFELAVKQMLGELGTNAVGAIDAVAHRIVHGGSRFTQPVRIDAGVIAALERLAPLAPLHTPPALDMLRATREAFGNVPHIALFDTAFHSTLPPRAREYALSREVTERFGLRRYGFHGINHAHVMRAVAKTLRTTPQQLRIVSCHLGNGASVAAIEYGRSVETSMGMTPLEGLVMGTRSGDVDPGILLQLLRSGEFDADALDALLNSQSGLLGLCGTFDFAAIEERAASGDASCRLALSVYAHRIRKYVGAYIAVMGGVDAIAFTGGVGEHSASLRHRICQRLDFCGALLDEDRNRDTACIDQHSIATFSADESRVHLLVVAANEELQMAHDAAHLLACATNQISLQIPVAVSARHAHLTQQTLDRLFGSGYQLRKHADLSQHGQFSAEETVTLMGPRGRIEHVRLMGPPRDRDQVEISRSDEVHLGIDAPVRLSGDLANTPGITIEGPNGRIALTSGVICARRHIHMSTEDAQRLGLRDHDSVAVKIDSSDRDLIFEDVTVRIDPTFALELHLDTDEANAAGIVAHQQAEVITTTSIAATISRGDR